MNIKKLFAVLAGVSMLAQTVVPSAGVFGAEYSEELQGAYNWAYSKGVTTMSSIDNANMYGAITRAEMAKMLSVYAESSLGITADTSKACTFTDIDSVKGDLHDFIIKSCQLGIMGQGITAFRPYDTLSRAEFGTALSRVLWGDKYEGGTPYYANHLNALKAAGIMNQIANAESTKEVRGYVMLMLQRSEGSDAGVDCDDPVVALACSLDTDECPAACKEGSKEDDTDTVVKSGDLDVTVSGDSNGRVFIGRASDLDTITLKTSEDVTITKIVLERIGYSTASQIVDVKLEDSKGATIADAKTLDSKGQVKLTLKKDYKVVDGELDAVIVVNTYDSTTAPTAKAELKPGATVGFKVVDVESTAKNVNISGKANEYTAVDYDGSVLTFSNWNTSDKDYNWEAGNLYEVVKFKVKAPDDSSILLRGFTFTNIAAANKMDIRKYFDKAEVTIAGEKVSGLDASVNKDDELVVTFKDVEVAAKAKSEVIVKIALADDFDQFGVADSIQLNLKDFVAVDGKVESRVKATAVATDSFWNGWTYVFKGGKVKLANVKLGNIDVALESEGVAFAEWTITVNEAIKWSFIIDAKWAAAGAIKQLTVVVNGEETEASPAATPAVDTTETYSKWALVKDWGKIYVANAASAPGNDLTDAKWTELWTVPGAAWVNDFARFYFNNVEIDKSGKIKFLIDTIDATDALNTLYKTKAVNFTTFNSDAFSSVVYDESNKSAKSEVSWSISLSKVTIQPAKASMTNSTNKEVEFANKETNRKVVFDGTYTAKKGDVKLNKFTITSKENKSDNFTSLITTYNKVRFYVTIDWTEVADGKIALDSATNKYVISDTFNDILVKNGESVKVKVEAEVEANDVVDGDEFDTTITYAGNTYVKATSIDLGKYIVKIEGEDSNGNKAGEGSADTVALKVVIKGSVSISAGAVKETVLYKASNVEVAAFTVKPANNASETDLEEIKFDIDASSVSTADDLTVKVNNVEADDCSLSTNTVTCSFNEKIGSDWVKVSISLDEETTWVVTIDNLYINGKPQTRTFKKRFEPALVWINSMKDLGGTTEFTLGVDKDSDITVKNLVLYFDIAADGTTVCSTTPATDGCKVSLGATKVFDEGDTIEAKWQKDWVRLVRAISYTYTDTAGDHAVLITKDATDTEVNTSGKYFYGIVTPALTKADNYPDFFKVGDAYARAYKAN